MMNNWNLLFRQTEENLMVQIGTVNLLSGERHYHRDINPDDLDEDILYYLGDNKEYHKLK